MHNLFYILCAVFVGSVILDVVSTNIAYGRGGMEGTHIYADEHGRPVLWKILLVAGIVLAGAAILFAILRDGPDAYVLMPIAVLGWASFNRIRAGISNLRFRQ